MADYDHWMKLYAEYKDLFEEPSIPVELDKEYQINLLNADELVKYYK